MNNQWLRFLWFSKTIYVYSCLILTAFLFCRWCYLHWCACTRSFATIDSPAVLVPMVTVCGVHNEYVATLCRYTTCMCVCMYQPASVCSLCVLLTAVSMDGQTLSSTVTQLLTKSPNDKIRLLSAQWWVGVATAYCNTGSTTQSWWKWFCLYWLNNCDGIASKQIPV